MCCVVQDSYLYSDITWFDCNEFFSDPEQMRDQFKVEITKRIYPEWSKKTGLMQVDLDVVAGAVIHQKWHCDFDRVPN